jgi:hypothetical protein
MYIITVKIPMSNKWFVVCQFNDRKYISSKPNPALVIQFEKVSQAESFARDYLVAQDEIKIVRMTQKSLYRRFTSRGI